MTLLLKIGSAALTTALLAACHARPREAESTAAAASATIAAPQAAKRSKADDEMIGLAMTGIDHLQDHVSIQEFSVNGSSGARAGKGGSQVCCVMVPRKWRPGLKATIRWGVLNWRDRATDEYEAVVEIGQFEELGIFFVHFLPDGTVRAVVSDQGPRSPTYPGPRVPIPQKYPWDKYDLPGGTPLKCIDHTVTPAATCKD